VQIVSGTLSDVVIEGNDAIDRFAQQREVGGRAGKVIVQPIRQMAFEDPNLCALFKRQLLEVLDARLRVQQRRVRGIHGLPRIVLLDNAVQRGSGSFGNVDKDDGWWLHRK